MRTKLQRPPVAPDILPRARLLPQPQREEIRRRLREYVDVRLEAALQPERQPAAIARSEQLHHEMWAHATALVAAGHKSEIDALFIDSLNRTIDLHTRRAATSLHYRVPDIVWVLLLGVTVISMVMVGYLLGMAGSGNWMMKLALAMVFSAVIALTSDLDRPSAGMLRVSQVPMLELQRSMQAAELSASDSPAPMPEG